MGMNFTGALLGVGEGYLQQLTQDDLATQILGAADHQTTRVRWSVPRLIAEGLQADHNLQLENVALEAMEGVRVVQVESNFSIQVATRTAVRRVLRPKSTEAFASELRTVVDRLEELSGGPDA